MGDQQRLPTPAVVDHDTDAWFDALSSMDDDAIKSDCGESTSQALLSVGGEPPADAMKSDYDEVSTSQALLSVDGEPPADAMKSDYDKVSTSQEFLNVEIDSRACHYTVDAIRCVTLSDHEKSTLKAGNSSVSASGDGSDTTLVPPPPPPLPPPPPPPQLYIETPEDQKEFLKEIVTEFVDKVEPPNMIDKMLGKGCLTLSDNESLKGTDVHNRREQARKLWNIMNGFSVEDFRSIVVPELLENYRRIIPPKYFTPKGEGSRGAGNNALLCLRHNLISRARLTTVADSLYHACNGWTLKEHQKILQSKLSNPEVWEVLFRVMADQDDIATDQMTSVFCQELRRYRLQVPGDLQEQIRRGVPCTCRLPDYDLPPGAPPFQNRREREDAGSLLSSQDGCNRLYVKRFQSPGSQYLGSDDPDFTLPEPDPDFKSWAVDGGLSEEAFKMLLREDYTSMRDVRRLEVGTMERFLPRLPSLPGKQRQILEELVQGLKTLQDLAGVGPEVVQPPPGVPALSDVLSDIQEKIRLLLVGKTGAGKSCSGNTLLGRDAFGTCLSMSSTTRDFHFACSADENVEVMDCPGLFDTRLSLEDLCTILVRALVAMAPGPSAVLYTIRIGDHYTDEEFETYQRLKRLYGPKICRYMIVVFTRGDELKKAGKSIEDYVKDAPERFKDVLRECGSRYVVLDNTPEGKNAQQLEELKRKVMEIVDRDQPGEAHSDLPIFSVPEEQLWEEIRRRIQEFGSFSGKESILKEEEGKSGVEGEGGKGGKPDKWTIFWQFWKAIWEWLKSVCRYT